MKTRIIAVISSIVLLVGAVSGEPDRAEAIGEAVEVGRLHTAARLCYQWLKDEPQNRQAQAIASRAMRSCARKGKTSIVELFCDEWSELDDDNNMHHIALGKLCEAADAIEKAIEHYESARTINPKNPESYRGEARIFAKAGKPDVAIVELEKALKVNNDASIMGDIARLQLKKRNYKAAASYAERAIELQPTNSYGHSTLAAVYFARGKRAGAMKEYRKAISFDPQNADARYGIAKLLEAAGKTADAEKQWDRFLRLERGTRRAGAIEYRRLKEQLQKDDWRKEWRIENWYVANLSRWIDEPINEPSGDNPNPGRKGVLKMHPFGDKDPAELLRTVELAPGKKFRLYIGVSGRNWDKWNCDSVLRVIVNGALLAEEIIDSGGDPSPENWYDLSYDLSDYAGERIEIKIQSASGGPANPWWGEEQFFDYIQILEVRD